ncbi:MAG: hypothetical protein VKP57_12140 [Candidatus Sericytochromatia bacterium]|nr:hypothetical protein [Candidatus Sericytochromatia bacterium]
MKIGQFTQNISSRIKAGKKDGSLSLDEAKGLRTNLQDVRSANAADRQDGAASRRSRSCSPA